MSSLLTKFLKDKGERYRAERADVANRMGAYMTAVRSLFEQLTVWVREGDPEGLVEIDRSQSFSLIDGPSSYHPAPVLGFRLGNPSVWVIPKSWNVVATVPKADGGGEQRADGLVILSDAPPTAGRLPAPTYNLYWAKDSSAGRWYIRHPLEDRTRPLDRERFEEVLVSMLQ